MRTFKPLFVYASLAKAQYYSEYASYYSEDGYDSNIGAYGDYEYDPYADYTYSDSAPMDYYYDDMGGGGSMDDYQNMDSVYDVPDYSQYGLDEDDYSDPQIYAGETDDFGHVPTLDNDDYTFFDQGGDEDDLGGDINEDADYDGQVEEMTHQSKADNEVAEIPDEDDPNEAWEDPEDESEINLADDSKTTGDDFTDETDDANMIEDLPDYLSDPDAPIDPNYVGNTMDPKEFEMVVEEITDIELNDGEQVIKATYADPDDHASNGGIGANVFYIENENKHTKERYDESQSGQDCANLDDPSESNLCSFRRARKNKSRNSNKKKFPKGVFSACGKSGKACASHLAMANCDRGWQSDTKQCGHGCRAEFIANNGRSSYKSQLYGSARYRRCELCAILSGMTKKHGYFQKALGNLKGGTPNFCDYKTDNNCQAKETRYAACSGLAVCQAACWSENSSRESCLACQKPWCKSKIWKKYFVTCGKRFNSCMAQYDPDEYNGASEEVQLEGQLNCWGTQPGVKKKTYLDKPAALPLEDQCDRAMNPSKYPFVEYKLYFQFCTERVCNLDTANPDANARRCEEVWCVYHGATSNGASKEYLNCNICRYCRIQNMALTGNYDRKLYEGKQNKIISELAIGEASDSQLWRPALQAMTTTIASLLPARGCTMCDLMFERVTCRSMCNALEAHIQKGTDPADPYFRWAHSICQSNRCVLHLQKACKTCTSNAEKLAKKTWANGLGQSEISNNFKGWGCQIDCRPYKMALMAEYPGVDITTGWTAAMQTGMGIISSSEQFIEMSEESWADILEWANDPSRI